MTHVIETREAFEGTLRTMQGLEFMISQDPSDNGHRIENSGVWVIRKQIRRKRQGAEDEILPIRSYFVVGENIYMAPFLGSIINNRMVCFGMDIRHMLWLIQRKLSTVTFVTKLVSTASALPIFTPSLGHTYLPAAPKSLSSATSTQVNQMSNESTPAPSTQETSASSKTPLSSKITSEADDLGLQTLAESYSLSLRYNNEYMDENPLVGEPGSFIMTKTREPAPQSALKIQTSITTKPAEAPETKSITPFAPGKKVSKGAEKSPITTGTKDKKARRKSKAAGVGTPK
jgi:mediator of RNA polymerase II transcription subunit 6